MSCDYPYAATGEGRILIALRAGPVYSEPLHERVGEFACQRAIPGALRAGLITRRKIDGFWLYELTASGRAKVPTRCSIVGWVPPECRAIATQSELMETA